MFELLQSCAQPSRCDINVNKVFLILIITILFYLSLMVGLGKLHLMLLSFRSLSKAQA